MVQSDGIFYSFEVTDIVGGVKALNDLKVEAIGFTPIRRQMHEVSFHFAFTVGYCTTSSESWLRVGATPRSGAMFLLLL